MPVNNSSAYDVLVDYYNSIGLGSLAPKILEYSQQGMGADELYIKLQQTAEWKQRFAGNELRKKAGLPPLDPASYIAKEAALREQLRSYGLPSGFYDDPSDFAKAIGADLGAQELGRRLAARKAVLESNPEVLGWFRDHYLTSGDALAFWTDPDRATPLLEKMSGAAQIGAAAGRTGWGDIGRSEAERLYSLDVTAQQAQEGFSQITGLNELTSDLSGGGSGLTRDELVSAQFEGNADAQDEVKKLQGERKAAFAGGGGFAETKEGIKGLGTSKTL